MLRPSNSLLGSSRAAQRATLRAETFKAVGRLARGTQALVAGLIAIALDVVLLWALPFVYMAAAFFALDLPARWLGHRPGYGQWGVPIFVASLAVCFTGLARAVQESPPLVPVRPKFAKAMLGLSWVAALILTIGDLAS